VEEGGHYYTVYYTSMAVGYKEDVAFRHAVLCQMPDEVGRMDASNMHQKELFGTSEIDFNNQQRSVFANERYGTEYGLHSLPGNNLGTKVRGSAYQRDFTTTQLMMESPTSLRFGLLLHRLGDTYAHSIIGNEDQMYSVTPTTSRYTNFFDRSNDFGHGYHMHDPDFAFLRVNLFYSYLENLYNVLLNKLNENANHKYRRANYTSPSFSEVRGHFVIMFNNLNSRSKLYGEAHRVYFRGGSRPGTVTKDMKAQWLIDEIRLAAPRNLKLTMRDYKPENEEGLSLREFLRRHPSLNDLNINQNTLSDSIESMIPGKVGNGLLTPPPLPPPTEYVPSYEFYGP
jgi:hypothetical protein